MSTRAWGSPQKGSGGSGNAATLQRKGSGSGFGGLPAASKSPSPSKLKTKGSSGGRGGVERPQTAAARSGSSKLPRSGHPRASSASPTKMKMGAKHGKGGGQRGRNGHRQQHNNNNQQSHDNHNHNRRQASASASPPRSARRGPATDDGMTPPIRVNVSNLSQNDVMKLLEAHGTMPSGFHSEDCVTLQKLLDAEYQTKMELYEQHVEQATKQAMLKAAQRHKERLAFREQLEEEMALRKRPDIDEWLRQVNNGTANAFAHFNVRSSVVRYIAKQLPSDCCLRSLALMRNKLNDEAGIALGVRFLFVCLFSFSFSLSFVAGPAGRLWLFWCAI